MPHPRLAQLEEEALQLDLDDRAALATKLLESLEEPSEEEILQLWMQEAERRLQDFREGKTRGIPAEEVFQRASAN